MDQFGELVLIALGSNKNSPWGDPTETVQKAILTLRKLTQAASDKSRLFATPAFPADSGPDFVNAAVAMRSAMPAEELLEALHQIEADADRERHGRWTQRTLDLDLIAMGDHVCPDAQTQTYWRNLPLTAQQAQAPARLILPHPRMQDRPFVLVPLVDIAPDWRHPLLGLTVLDMLANCDAKDVASVKPLR